MAETLLTNMIILGVALLCPLFVVALLSGSLWAIIIAFQESRPRLQQQHSIPCDRCTYFTGSRYLQCAVHPYSAFTEEAVECPDFELVAPKRSGFSRKQLQKVCSFS
jgi:hypothetical protein